MPKKNTARLIQKDQRRIEELLAADGAKAAFARLLRVTPATVSNWMSIGFPYICKLYIENCRLKVRNDRLKRLVDALKKKVN